MANLSDVPAVIIEADDKKAMIWRIRSKAARGDRAAQAWLMQNDKERRR